MQLPCAIVTSDSDADALEASLIENVARAPMDELEEYEAFAKLLKQGRAVPDIAKTFGVTERYVKQRLALAGLHGAIKDAYRGGEIEAEDLQLLACATRRQQKDWVTAFQTETDAADEGEAAPRGAYLKQWLFGTEQIATSVALFSVEVYKGEIIADLFGDVRYFADANAFWALQNAAIAGRKDELAALGWTVTVLEKGARFQSWRYDVATLEDDGEAFIKVRANGEVEIHQGYRLYKEMSSGGEGAGAARQDTEEKQRSELTKAAENYLALHRHAIVRAELLARPAIALRLAAAHMIAGSPLWSVKPDPQTADKDTIAASLATSPAQATLNAERDAVLELLGAEKSYYGSLTRGNGDGFTGASLFARLLELPDDAVLRIIALVMAETLAAGSVLTEAAGMVLKPDAARWWKLDETFLDLLRDRTAINAMLCEVAGKDIADANVSEPSRLQKKIIHECLKGEGRAEVEGFVPCYMRFPIGQYDPAKPLLLARACEIINPLFTGV